MKLLGFCIVAIIGFAAAKPTNDRECIWVNGQCSELCPEGTHSYTVGCDYVTPEPSCNNPTPKADTSGMVCDLSACYCNSPNVRDTKADKCVPVDQCPNTE